MPKTATTRQERGLRAPAWRHTALPFVLVVLIAGTACSESEPAQGTPPAPVAAATDSATAGSEASPATPAKPPAAADENAVAQLDAFIAEKGIDKSAPGWKTKLPKPPQARFGGETYYWKLETNVGDIKLRLMPDVAPMHTSSTIYLTRLGFYDGVPFHRVITGFMAQGGDPLGVGRGGPGYQYAGEFRSDVVHDRPGLLSMANAGPGTDGSQFFITFVPTPHLNGRHTIFGEVVEGMDTVKALEERGSRGGRPREQLQIDHATIIVE